MGRSLLSPKPSEYVASALKTLGAQSVTNGCIVHNIQVRHLFQLIYLRFI